ncbi:hypothetical protein [Flammeovirga sp. SubArs3]|uniref:hypothetical protein n=1 Tax=Flammeovirga sp. SubArs3 TaxID=2995316 RepID=UPI00248C9032|nr:hypothetical protein [Flammeovirga sp. SubArs3]
MKLTHLLFILFSVLLFTSCEKESNSQEEEQDGTTIFDFFPDMGIGEDETVEDKTKLETPEIEVDTLVIEEKNIQEKTEIVVEKEVLLHEEIEEEDLDTEELPEINEDLVDEEILLDYEFKELGFKFKAIEEVSFKQATVSDKHFDKGLIARFTTTYSYFDVYDMDRSINWSGAGDFAEFGQGFYERSKNVWGGKYGIFAKRRAYTFHAKAMIGEDMNYSNIKKFKSDRELNEEDLVNVKVVFFGRGNFGYRLIYNPEDPYIAKIEKTVEFFTPEAN